MKRAICCRDRSTGGLPKLPFAITPRRQDQTRCFGSGKPSVASGAPLRQHNLDNFRAKPFAPVVIDRRAQIFELSPSSAFRADGCILSTNLPVDIGESCIPEIIVEGPEPCGRLVWSGVGRGYILGIKVQHISYRDRSWVTVTLSGSRPGVLGREVSRERPFSSANVVCSAARGFIVAGVADNPDGATDGPGSVFPLRSEPQSGTFASSRHNSLIFSIAERVT